MLCLWREVTHGNSIFGRRSGWVAPRCGASVSWRPGSTSRVIPRRMVRDSRSSRKTASRFSLLCCCRSLAWSLWHSRFGTGDVPRDEASAFSCGSCWPVGPARRTWGVDHRSVHRTDCALCAAGDHERESSNAFTCARRSLIGLRDTSALAHVLPPSRRQ